ncbi:ankyrin repeat protein [Cetobacterium somerae ATCC BAA-474]|jgi:ankyrin repeat protein|uniref:Ankyrin repeat protein n=1 Tax=Cetobacterium somerae ATCC BAA-474 TaxID=1319815 RepID=U7VDE7_9FUSO|nr:MULTISPECIES: ankyrin repeat domain-containing protein [Cetobacterium]ERT69717.1 ankyrin repeat protein [Cetobacterium somerae ATCC BAA-474]MBC2853429.1 ankyrin repeat domain-containing protein [Cetobacterium sp. 2G large]
MIEFKNALKNGDLEKLKVKLEDGIDVNDRSGEYRYPIHKAVLLKDTNIVKLFLDYNADINIQEPLQGNTPINLAIFNKDLQMVNFLKENGANLDIKNSWGMTSLEYAIYLKNNMSFDDIDNIIETLK